MTSAQTHVEAPLPLHFASTLSAVKASDLAIFLLGTLCWLEIRLVGVFYVGELILAAIALGFPFMGILRQKDAKFLRLFLSLGALYLLSLVFTDIYRGTPVGDFSRGWLRTTIFLAGFMGLIVIGYKKPKRLLIWVAGSALSLWLNFLLFRAPGSWVEHWKADLGEIVIVSVLLCLNSRRTLLSYVTLAALTVLNLLFDARSPAIFCLLTLIMLFIKMRRPRTGKKILRAQAIVFTVLVVAAFAWLYSFSQSAGANFYGNKDLTLRRDNSGAIRLAGFYVAFRAISESPVIGHGSWAGSYELARFSQRNNPSWGGFCLRSNFLIIILLILLERMRLLRIRKFCRHGWKLG